MIFIVCIQIFVVSSMFLQRVLNESSLKEHWNIKVSEITTTKNKKFIINVCIEVIKVSSTSLQRIINND